MLRDFINDSDEKNRQFYSVFKVSREDQRQQKEALLPPKREKSPEDPFFQKLEYKPYHVGVHDTRQIMSKLAPHESRLHTNKQQVEDFLDQHSRFYNQKKKVLNKNNYGSYTSGNTSGMSDNNKSPKANEAKEEEAHHQRSKGLQQADHSRLKRINKELNGLHRLTQVEGETDYFENASNVHFNEQMDREGSSVMKRVEPSNNSVEDRGNRIQQAQRNQDRNFAQMVNTEGFTNFRFTQRAKNILSPIHVQAGEIAGSNEYTLRKRQL